MVSVLVRAVLFALVFAGSARAEMTIRPGDMRFWVEVEEANWEPFVEEMVLLKIRGAYKIPISLENVLNPSLEGFGWMQLGEDTWFESTERGQRVVNLERIMAVFPEKDGTLEIGSFTHELTLTEPNGTRFRHDLTSAPVALTVREAPGDAASWMPLRQIEIEDDWSNAPERLDEGMSALRKVTVTMVGVQPERIPPMPEMTGAGAYILPHPEQRITVLRKRGPVTRVFWRWSIRPEQGRSGYVDPLDLSYFDAVTRESKTVTLSAQRVAYDGQVDTGVSDRDRLESGEIPILRDGNDRFSMAGFAPFAGVIGFLVALFILFRNLRFAGWSEARRIRERVFGTADERALKRAVRMGDAARARWAAQRVGGADGGRPDRFDGAFSMIDPYVFGTKSGQPPLADFRRAFMKARRSP